MPAVNSNTARSLAAARQRCARLAAASVASASSTNIGGPDSTRVRRPAGAVGVLGRRDDQRRRDDRELARDLLRGRRRVQRNRHRARPRASPRYAVTNAGSLPAISATRSPGATWAASSEVGPAPSGPRARRGSPDPRSRPGPAGPASLQRRPAGPRPGSSGAEATAGSARAERGHEACEISLKNRAERVVGTSYKIGGSGRGVGGVVVAGKFPESSAHAASQPAPPTSTTAAGPLSCDHHRARLRSGAFPVAPVLRPAC